jgi:hypothetical protein
MSAEINYFVSANQRCWFAGACPERTNSTVGQRRHGQAEPIAVPLALQLAIT